MRDLVIGLAVSAYLLIGMYVGRKLFIHYAEEARGETNPYTRNDDEFTAMVMGAGSLAVWPLMLIGYVIFKETPQEKERKRQQSEIEILCDSLLVLPKDMRQKYFDPRSVEQQHKIIERIGHQW